MLRTGTHPNRLLASKLWEVATISVQPGEVGRRLQLARRRAGLSLAEASDALHLGPGWLRALESGDAPPDVGLIVAATSVYSVSSAELLDDIVTESGWAARSVTLVDISGGVSVEFDYGLHIAHYEIPGATIEEVEAWDRDFRTGLQQVNNRSNAVANAYLAALQTWTGANPAEIWAFLVQQIYLDLRAHPAGKIANTSQSWKRAAGWALERVLVRRYDPLLRPHGISLEIPRGTRKELLVRKVQITHGANPDKIDVFLVGDPNGLDEVFGIAHVKASLAERRSDDQPMSERVMDAGMESLFLTLDAKSHPTTRPVAHGEYGSPRPKDLKGTVDPRSDKRREVEVAGAFSGCFSWNPRTIPTPDWQRNAVKTPIDVVNFHNDDSAFTRHVIAAWKRFQRI